ncbi:hypothetical protein BGW36DRAFT_432197 [Talaromyces proteolyticus]|uniref:Uncharacterized protein n=1 Tax=Talaromyces proteolyticus TaxID=1131652 RepID=A0AAD4KGK9_9EURO|nr:uncharacterized protein BGW36DRAFT_432197 [Talaromyces proteolyticus]KAH8691649.1 hypothetical protein BGW36DRAFT_432197 [Talaromyces proteolyticus]
MDGLKQATEAFSQHTEEQKQQQFYNSLPAKEQYNMTYAEWVKEAYNEQYEKWMPWIEDQYLKWFGNGDNKASYTVKDTLNKTKVTSVSQIDQLQDDVHNLVGNQVGENGIAAPLGDIASKEGINRMERGGRDDKGSYGGPATQYTDPMIQNTKDTISGGMKTVGNSILEGAESTKSHIGLGRASDK